MRDKAQSMGLWLNETNVFSPAILEAAVHDLTRSGYGILRVMLRNTNLNHRSPAVVEAVAQLVRVAHGAGMRVALDCEPHTEPVAHDLGNLFPGAIGLRIVRAETPVVDGRFTVRLRAPATVGTRADFLRVEAAWLVEGGQRQRIEDLKFEHRMVGEPYANGFTTYAHTYTEGRPREDGHVLHLVGKLPTAAQGRLVVYVRFYDTRALDFWSEDLWRYYDQVLECYRGIALDGVGWDEPGTGGNWSHYQWGEATAAAFERLNGYALKDRWPDLDEPGTRPESLRVRLDYYRTMNEGLCEAQRRLIVKTRELFGEDALLGTHHTWQGEGGINDYRSWAVDYFRLNDPMDASYTDCSWWDPKSVGYAFTLGTSLGRLTPSGETEINNWDAKPSNARVEFYARLMTLLDVTWFNIWYGTATDTCLYPADYTWGATVREVNRHRDAQRWLGKAKPVIDVAMLHGWETVCGVNQPGIAGAHKAFCLNTATLFVERSVAFDWVDTRLLAASKVEGGRLVNALGSYSVLVLPYASVLPRQAWDACRAFARAGGKVVFVGPPPEAAVEGGSLRGEFAQWLEMPEISLDSYLTRIEAAYRLPAGRPNELEVCLELEGDPARLLTSVEEEHHGLRSADGNTLWLTDLDPRTRLLQIVEGWLASEMQCFSDRMLWRLYRDGERELVVCIASLGYEMRGLLRWGDEEVDFRGGTVALLEKVAGKVSIHATNAQYSIRRVPAAK